LLHQTPGRGEDGSDLIGWAGRPKVTFEEDRDARTRTSGATREKSDGPCRQRETERLHRGDHLIPITPEGSLRVPFTSTLIDPVSERRVPGRRPLSSFIERATPKSYDLCVLRLPDAHPGPAPRWAMPVVGAARGLPPKERAWTPAYRPHSSVQNGSYY